MIGEKLGSFQVEAILGTGAMGMVYRAKSELTGKFAAVKVINGEVSQRSKTYERFRREADILQQFRHPNIVRFLAVGRFKGTSYFAMEYVAGETLEQTLNRRGSLPWREAVALTIQICDALQYAHERSIVHRDLKPSNLMVSEEGQIKLTDFGIAKDLDATALTATGRTLGTAAYMAPEQIRGTPEVSHKTDLYALGVVVYQMLTGLQAFEGTSAVVLMHSHLNQPPPRPSAKAAEIPVALDKLVVQLMAKEPSDRPWDAVAVAHELSEIVAKATRGEPVPMVWATGSDRPTSGGKGGTAAQKKAKKKAKKASGESLWKLDRARLEVLLLLSTLAVLVGFLGYMLWPPSQQYLYHQAETLMASEHLHDWKTARDKFLDALDLRFPNNAYRTKTQEWRDRIELREAEGRAPFLASKTITKVNEPKTPGEHQYVGFHKLAAAASEEGDDRAAVGYWNEMAKALETAKPEPEDRRWILLAKKLAADLEKTMTERRGRVMSMLERAEQAAASGNTREAKTIRDDVWKRFHHYTDLTDVLQAAGLTDPNAAPAASDAGSATTTPK